MKIVYDGTPDKRMYKDIIAATIKELVENDENVVYLDADLMNCIGTFNWSKTSDRAINCGIAEANMVGIACGMATVGFKPIVHSFGPFASRRVFDQIFLSGAYSKNSITVIGTDPGVTAALNGGTHMPFEDMAMYRAIPEATVFDISDISMMEDILKKSVDMPGVKYIRVPRKNAVKLYEDGAEFEAGKGIVLREGSDVMLVACGIMTAKAMAAAEILSKEGIEAMVVDMFTVKPIDRELLISGAKLCGAVVSCENHNRIGGLSSAVADVLTAEYPVPQERVAIEDIFGEVGPQDYLEQRFMLTAENIAEKAKLAFARKSK